MMFIAVEIEGGILATGLFLALTAFAVYVSFKRPPWYWAVFVGAPVVLHIMARFVNFSTNAIPAGPVQLRATDAALFAGLAGGLYHARYEGVRAFWNKPMGRIMLAFFAFLVMKTLASILLYSDQIAANRSVSHAVGGLVAVFGELRDQFFPLIIPFYAYTTRKSCDLKELGWPIVVGILLILGESVVGIAVLGTIWSGADYEGKRFILSPDAITLTILCFMLPFVRVPRMSDAMRWGLAGVGIVFATLANHRSVWIAEVAGGAAILLAVVFGRPMLEKAKLIRVVLTGGALLMASLVATVAYMGNAEQRFPLIDVLTVRLYAITDPGRDPDAEWRATIWKDRIVQVGNDWPWGRPLGDRRESLFHGTWINLPDHSAYVSVYELGGAILCVIVFLFWSQILLLSLKRLVLERDPERLWPPAVAIAITLASLAFGSAYTFPYLGPSLAVVLTLGVPESTAITTASPQWRGIRWPIYGGKGVLAGRCNRPRGNRAATMLKQCQGEVSRVARTASSTVCR